jgi:hypothetical protein
MRSLQILASLAVQERASTGASETINLLIFFRYLCASGY